MTPEEILDDLRDIHLPEGTAETADAGFIYWPTALAVALILVVLGLFWWRRSAWRRDIARHLDAIERGVSEGRIREGWTELATLLRRIALGISERQDVAGLIGDAWLEKLDQLFRTDVFSRGPGRGVIAFPYGTDLDHDRLEPNRNADHLQATIDDIRKHLANLRRA